MPVVVRCCCCLFCPDVSGSRGYLKPVLLCPSCPSHVNDTSLCANFKRQWQYQDDPPSQPPIRSLFFLSPRNQSYSTLSFGSVSYQTHMGLCGDGPSHGIKVCLVKRPKGNVSLAPALSHTHTHTHTHTLAIRAKETPDCETLLRPGPFVWFMWLYGRTPSCVNSPLSKWPPPCRDLANSGEGIFVCGA